MPKYPHDCAVLSGYCRACGQEDVSHQSDCPVAEAAFLRGEVSRLKGILKAYGIPLEAREPKGQSGPVSSKTQFTKGEIPSKARGPKGRRPPP